MHPNKENLKTILSEYVSSNRYLVPDFQRDFVWKQKQELSLIDSLIRGYPIGSWLLLEKCDTYNFASKPLFDNVKKTYSLDSSLYSTVPNTKNTNYYVLDGQQRLTSLVKIFFGEHYYFDLDIVLNNLENDDVPDDFVVFYKKGLITDNSLKLKLLPLKLVTKPAKVANFLSNYLRSKSLSEEHGSVFQEYMHDLISGLLSREVIIHELPGSTKIEAVCKIFETINNSGTKLNAFDLVVAKNYSAAFNLRNELKELANKVQVPESEIVSESLLRIIVNKDLLSQGKGPSFYKSTLLEKSVEYWISEIEDASKKMSSMYKWLTEECFVKEPKYLELLTVALYANKDLLEKPTLKGHLKRWYFRFLLSDGYASTSEQYSILKSLWLFAKSESAADLPLKTPKTIDSSFMLQPNSNENRFSKEIVLSVLAAYSYEQYLGQDFYGDLFKASKPEVHHLIPQAFWTTPPVRAVPAARATRSGPG